ncbi:unannotated protein [freshwater metagenome]|uniref:Unannotated protein n=1 Tax=freshwater metagenome TaxID=449393 RepID=A0A6J7FVS8_9ZZZZ
MNQEMDVNNTTDELTLVDEETGETKHLRVVSTRRETPRNLIVIYREMNDQFVSAEPTTSADLSERYMRANGLEPLSPDEQTAFFRLVGAPDDDDDESVN